MDKRKKVLWKFLFPKTIWVFLLVNIAAFLLIYALRINNSSTFPQQDANIS